MHSLTRILFIAMAVFLGASAHAADYQVSVNWTDPTPAGAGYTALYDVEYRVNAGVSTGVSGLASPTWSGAMVANESDTIELRVRNRNAQGGLSSAWSAWYAATAPVIPVQPLDPTGVVITIVPQ